MSCSKTSTPFKIRLICKICDLIVFLGLGWRAELFIWSLIIKPIYYNAHWIVNDEGKVVSLFSTFEEKIMNRKRSRHLWNRMKRKIAEFEKTRQMVTE